MLLRLRRDDRNEKGVAPLLAELHQQAYEIGTVAERGLDPRARDHNRNRSLVGFHTRARVVYRRTISDDPSNFALFSSNSTALERKLSDVDGQRFTYEKRALRGALRNPSRILSMLR